MKVLKLFFVTFLFFSMCYCTDCERSKEFILEDKFCLVVEIAPLNYPDLFKTKGYDPNTRETKIYEDGNRWLDFYKKEIEVGDTIVKKRGELMFYIHKKDTVIAHEWVCYDGDGKYIYMK